MFFGMSICGRPYVLQVHPQKLKELVLATEALAISEREKPRLVASLLGMRTWALMICRPGFAILEQIYQWVQSFDEQEMEEVFAEAPEPKKQSMTKSRPPVFGPVEAAPR